LELTGIVEVQKSVIEISINRESTGTLFQELAKRKGIGEINACIDQRSRKKLTPSFESRRRLSGG
jgi:hypothetical protein